MNKNTTALMCLFVRYYHTNNSNIKVYNDTYAKDILTRNEVDNISTNLTEGINFFNKDYNGDNPLKWIVNNYLAPSILARFAFNERHLLNELKLGLKQYIILASGYDTSAYKFNHMLSVFEVDLKEMIDDKLKRVDKAGINVKNVTYVSTNFNTSWINDLLSSGLNKEDKSFCSALGISYYLDKEAFYYTVKVISSVLPKGSTILFDYPNNFETSKEKINRKLALAAGEKMKSIYSYKDMEALADKCDCLIYEHLNNADINNQYFYNYNTLNPGDKLSAPEGVSYVMFVKQ